MCSYSMKAYLQEDALSNPGSCGGAEQKRAAKCPFGNAKGKTNRNSHPELYCKHSYW